MQPPFEIRSFEVGYLRPNMGHSWGQIWANHAMLGHSAVNVQLWIRYESSLFFFTKDHVRLLYDPILVDSRMLEKPVVGLRIDPLLGYSRIDDQFGILLLR